MPSEEAYEFARATCIKRAFCWIAVTALSSHDMHYMAF